jgi:hypothetical protein
MGILSVGASISGGCPSYLFTLYAPTVGFGGLRGTVKTISPPLIDIIIYGLAAKLALY